jgi:putative DNA primase/helicase
MTEASVIKLPSSDRQLSLARGDHVELAERLVATLREAAPTVFADGAFYQYVPQRGAFALLDKARLSRIVQSFAGSSVAASRAPLSVKASDVAGAIRLASDQAAEPCFFADAPAGVAFANGFLVVLPASMDLQPHSPANRARVAFDFDFESSAQPELLFSYFEQVFRDDGEDERARKIALLQEYVGVSLLGKATRYQRVIVKVGQGANGKGVLACIIEGVMPAGSVCAIPPQDLGQEYRRALLAGKLLNIVSELPEADILDSESWKSIVAGDTTTGREIRKEPFSFRPVAGHIYSANRLPGTTDQTHGFWRRMIVVPFERVFAEHEQDPTLAERIVAAERPAIVSWVLAGAQRVLQRGHYPLPASSDAALQEWQRASDQVRAFVDERCERLPSTAIDRACVRAGDLYAAFREWSISNGHKPLASNKFGTRMKSIGLPSEHFDDGNRYRVRVKS